VAEVGALGGVRVLDVTQVMAGPYCAMQLCDMGADVIKIEPPEGDSTRRMAGAAGTDSPAFNAVNRGKRGIVLNLKSPAACDAFKRLDVVRRLDSLAADPWDELLSSSSKITPKMRRDVGMKT